MSGAIRGISVYRIRDSVARSCVDDIASGVLSVNEAPDTYRGRNPTSRHRLTLAVAQSRQTCRRYGGMHFSLHLPIQLRPTLP